MPVLTDGLDAHSRRDFSRARADFRRLAAQGSAIAETMLGVMTSEGQGSRRDPASAAMWWLRAANRGYAPAQLAIAEAFIRGKGVPRDLGSAWVWARLAETRGDNRTAAAAKLLAARLAPGFDAPTLAKSTAAGWRGDPGRGWLSRDRPAARASVHTPPPGSAGIRGTVQRQIYHHNRAAKRICSNLVSFIAFIITGLMFCDAR